jgi:hypothetical protein
MTVFFRNDLTFKAPAAVVIRQVGYGAEPDPQSQHKNCIYWVVDKRSFGPGGKHATATSLQKTFSDKAITTISNSITNLSCDRGSTI